jgi:hypothetical protein
MFKRILILFLIFIAFAGTGYYLLDQQGAFQTKEEIYANDGDTPMMKCEAGKCAAGKCAGGK